MPSKLLPTFLQSDIEAHASSKSCYVTIGAKVYDITPFLEDHPGGGDLILEYGGKDVQEIMGDEISHAHSESAYDILDEHLVGFVATDEVLDAATKSEQPDGIVPLPPSKEALQGLPEGIARPIYANTGMASADDLSRETDTANDYRTHKFLDLDRPLLMQIWNGGFSKDFYLEQVHRPRHYKGGASAPLFGNFLEPLSKTPWWVVPMVWLPAVTYGTNLSRVGLSGWGEVGAYWTLGLAMWTLVEYILHRGLFHVDGYLPNNRVAITGHFLLHGIHHYLPMDKLRLVMPPTLFIVLASPFWQLAHFVFYYNWYAATAVFCGAIFGYICYDLTHYFLHHRQLPAYYRELKKYHLQHHFADYENGFGVTSRFWDRVFGTELAPPKAAKAA
ncbi:MAG: ATP-dependent RNA helicase dbp6 [Chaenotheca gracillima]|nr:MAG: ATP-dependent RNA helicase dbp6 [Chaenotheca gracillima]